jgi:hypothetical protein
MAKTVIHLRNGDRTRTLVGPRARKVAERLAGEGWEPFTYPEPYDAAKAAQGPKAKTSGSRPSRSAKGKKPAAFSVKRQAESIEPAAATASDAA